MHASDPYPPIGDYAVIGDCHSAALISRTGSIDWCCLPRFDSGSAFGRMLDWERGGHCSISPLEGSDWDYSREYVEDTLVLETRIHGASGEIRLLDCMTVHPDSEARDERQILRVIEGVRGSVEVEIRVAPRFDYGEVRPWIRRHGLRVHSAIGGNDGLVIWCDHGEMTEDPEHELAGTVRVAAGDRIRLSLTYQPPERIDFEGVTEPDPQRLDASLEDTIGWWREWAGSVALGTRDEPGVKRSGITLKALTYAPTGAIAAAPTTSLPEVLGGSRNWDYRYSWVRDASFSSRAFAELGCYSEADSFRAFIMRSAAGHAGDLQVFYGVGGERRLGQETLELEGYRGSSPVNVGNAASDQLQTDAYGELINLTWRWHRRGHSPSDDHWRFLVSLINHAAEKWSEPDRGIWEWPGDPDHFVHSKVLCWATLERGIRLADECMRRAPTRRWKQARDELREAIERRGFDRKRGVFVQAFDRSDLDAALLLLPTVEFVAWDDERMVRTVAAIREDLDAGDGLLFRYTRDDGLPGKEGAFLCCSFWLVECLARMGELEDARKVFDQTMAKANDIGLFSEEFDPRAGALLGNFPQGLTHLAHIDAAVALSEAQPGA